MDADLEYLPDDVSLLLEPLCSGDADVVFGTRGFQVHSAYSFWYVIGKRAVTFALDMIYNCLVSDIMTGRKAIRADVFKSLALRERGFASEAEITGRIRRQEIRTYEALVVYKARSREDGKKLTTVDGFRVLPTLVRYRVA